MYWGGGVKNLDELNQHIIENIQGMFHLADMAVMKQEIEKLKPGQIYLEIGVDEGRSMAVAHHYAKKGVFIIGIDIHDVYPHPASIGRGVFAEQEGIIGIKKRGFFIHGDADEFVELWDEEIDLLFIDGHHDYESVKKNTLKWEGEVKKGGTILFHDYDHPDTKRWLDEHYGDDKEIFHGKIVKVVV